MIYNSLNAYKHLLKRFIPRLYASLDEFPRQEILDSSHDLPVPQRFSGWACHLKGPVEIRLEVDGQLLDRFYPLKKREDVQEHLSSIPSALYSGFEREYSLEDYLLLVDVGAELVAVRGTHRELLWKGSGTRSFQELRLDLEASFPLLLADVRPSAENPFCIVILGEPQDDLVSRVKQEARDALGSSRFSVWEGGHLGQERWEEAISERLFEESWILFLDEGISLDRAALSSLFGAVRKEQSVSLFRSVKQGEMPDSACPNLVGATAFDSTWLASSSMVRAVAGGRRIAEPLLQQRAWKSAYAPGVSVCSSVFSRTAGSLQQKVSSHSEDVITCLLMPYRFGVGDDYEEQRRQLLAEHSSGALFGIVRDRVSAAGQRLDELPIFSIEELLSCDLAGKSVEVIPTDCWSLRLGNLLSYCLGATVQRPPSFLPSEDWYPELANAAEWAGWEPSKSVTRAHDGISIVVPIYNAIDHVLMCVRSVLPQLEAQDELILVNDCSDFGTTKFLRAFAESSSRIRLVEREENGGFIEACYSGLQAANQQNHLVLLNSDVVCSAATLKSLRRALHERPDAYLFSPFSTGSRKLQVDVPPGNTLEGVAKALQEQHTAIYPTVVTPEGQCLLVRREAIDAVGFFDRVYHRGFCEESDLAMRVLLYGGDTVVVDDALIYHEQSASFGSAQRNYHMARNRPIFDERWGVEYLAAFEAYQQRGEVSAIREKLAFSGASELSQPTDHGAEEEFVARVEAARKNVVQPLASQSEWLDQAEVVFILPAIVGGGGSLSVLQHVNEMLQQGIEARVITVGKIALDEYPLLTTPLSLTPEQVLSLPWKGQRVIATFWTTAYLVRAITERAAAVKGFYYIQDYEAWFHEEGTPQAKLAAATYEFPLHCVAKTQFLCDTVYERHQVSVSKVIPGIDRLVFYPGKDRTLLGGAPRFTAMYRPATPRRGGDRLITFFEALLARVPEAQITLFGDRGGLPSSLSEQVQCTGRVSRKKVAELYRESDFSVDLSYFHGFGRPGIEAMACGVVPILTASGGVSEFAVNDENSLIVDPNQMDQEVSKVIELFQDKERLQVFRDAAITRAELWSEWKATRSWCELLQISPPLTAEADLCQAILHPDDALNDGKASLSIAR